MKFLEVKPDDKFIIEIAEILQNNDPFGGPPLYRIKGFPTLVFTKKDLDTLENYNPLKTQKLTCKNNTLYFFNEKERMCYSMKNCNICPLKDFNFCIDGNIREEIIDIVQNWSNKNPIKTEKDMLNQKLIELKNIYPEINLNRNNEKIILEIDMENINE